MNISDNDIAGINEAWNKLLGLTGVRSSAFKMGDYLAEPMVSTQDVVFYVNPSGDDNNDGSATRPFRTLAKAAKEVPALQANNVTINLSAGTHTVDTEVMIGGIQLSQNIDFKIQGAGFAVITPTTGVASGTFTSAGDWTLNMTGAGWTSSDLIGKFVKITSGSLNGEYFPIAGNTATAIEVAKKMLTAAATATFEIVEPTTVINMTGSSWINTTTVPASRQSGYYTPSTSVHAAGVIFDSVKITSASTSQYLIRTSPTGALIMHRCYVRSKDDTSAVRTEGGMVMVTKSYVASKSVSSPSIRAIAGNVATRYGITLSSVVADGVSGSGNFCYGVYSTGPTTTADSIIQGFSGGTSSAGILTTAEQSYVTNTLIRNSAIGIQVSTTCNLLTLLSTSIKNVTVGIDTLSQCYVKCTGLVIDTCTSHGIRCNINQTSIDITDTASSIINCGGFGVALASSSTPKACTYNSLRIKTATMSGNTAGDMTIDGTTPISYATLAADPDKTIVDSVLFSRISLD